MFLKRKEINVVFKVYGKFVIFESQYGSSVYFLQFLIDCNISRYVLLYNSECDSENPRPISEIIRLTEKEEKQIPTQNQQQVYYIYEFFDLPICAYKG